MSNTKLILLGTLAAVFAFGPSPSSTAQVIVEPTPADRASVSVEEDVTFDSASGLYIYSYELTNAATSEQAVWMLAIEHDSELSEITAPEGWTAEQHVDRPILSWAATDTPLPPDYVDDGNIPPSPFSVQPGATLGGFSFRSPDPPATAVFFAQGDVPLAQVATDVGELPLEGEEIGDFTEDSFVGNTISPKVLEPQEVFGGGRRPAVDGFLGFVNIRDRDTRQAPFSVIVRFSVNGETVDTATFSATLNRVDVTAAFQPTGDPNERVAIFDLASTPLELGRNVLLTSVDGIVSGTTRTASDVDRLTIQVE